MDRITIPLENGGAGILGQTQKLGIMRLAAYEDIGKTPDEIQEILDKDNRLISEYAEENKHLKNIIECLKDEIVKQDKQLEEVVKAVKAVHDAAVELDAVINL